MLKRAALVALLFPACTGQFSGETDNQRLAGPSDALTGASPRDLDADQVLAISGRIVDLYQTYAEQHLSRIVIDYKAEGETAMHLQPDRRWIMQVSDDVLRAGETTPDVVALIMCHELGHALGGFPFKDHKTKEAGGLAADGSYGTVTAAEGQADYFAAKDCLPRLWAGEAALNATFAAVIPADHRARCDQAYAAQRERDICYRTVHTAEAFALWLAEGSEEPGRLDRRDPAEVAITKAHFGYPSRQSRLDTHVAGALCPNKRTDSTIPGLVEPYAQLPDPFNPYARDHAARFACMSGPGARPRSWFNPDMVPFACGDLDSVGGCNGDIYEYCTPTTGYVSEECRNCRVDEEEGLLCD